MMAGRFKLFLLSLLIPPGVAIVPWGTCGGFLDLSVTPGGTITSPGHGESVGYDDEEYCVWLLQAPQGYRVRLTINYVRLEIARSRYGYGYQCRDYVEVCSGLCSRSTHLYYHCAQDNGNTATPVAVKTSSSRWMRIKFKSDHSLSGDGFNMTYTTTPGQPGDSTTPPFVSCTRSDQFQCVNKECVLRTRLCDGHDQCGDNSDETHSSCIPVSQSTVTRSTNPVTRRTPATPNLSSTKSSHIQPLNYLDGTSASKDASFGHVTVPIWAILLIVCGVLVSMATIVAVLQVIHLKQRQKLRKDMTGDRVHYTPNTEPSPGSRVHIENQSSADHVPASRRDINDRDVAPPFGQHVLPPIRGAPPTRDVFAVSAPPPYESRVNLMADDQAIAIAPPPYVRDISDQSDPPKEALPGGHAPGVYLGPEATETGKK